MAAAIPPALRTADIARFAQRAGQVEKAKPVVAYWCNYWIVEQILAKGLHKANDESMTYTMNLMDKLEQTKSDFAENDAIVDDVAGQAYVEQFGLETFQRAENAMKANKASRQTAETFQAAATFLDLCQIWGPLDLEVASKIKFAKYHALRIAKALKAGEDPNASNPTQEPVPNVEQPLDPNDPDVQMINGNEHQQSNGPQPYVQDVPDEHDQLQSRLAQHPAYDESLHPSRTPSVRLQASQAPSPQATAEEYYSNPQAPEVSPLGPLRADRTMSEGGGYFRSAPNGDEARTAAFQTASPEDPVSPVSVHLDPDPQVSPSSMAGPGFPQLHAPPPNSLHSFPPPNVDEWNMPAPTPVPFPSYPRPRAAPRPAPQTPTQPPLPTPSAPIRQLMPHPVAPVPLARETGYRHDEESVMKAQKHAKFAISALNFEDANTAVKELMYALEALGAR